MGLWIDAGSRFETEKNNGVAHFLEHMAFKVCSFSSFISLSPLSIYLSVLIRSKGLQDYTCMCTKHILHTVSYQTLYISLHQTCIYIKCMYRLHAVDLTGCEIKHSPIMGKKILTVQCTPVCNENKISTM